MHTQNGLKKDASLKDSPYKISWKQIFSLSFRVDKDAVQGEEKTDGVFPLITNLDAEAYPAKNLLFQVVGHFS